jgi:Na+/citrate or Na+/malate symporter
MVILNPQIIYKIEAIKKTERIRNFFRLLYIFAIIIGTVLALTSGRLQEFSYLIIICLISTYVVSVVTDFYVSDLDSALEILEYDKCKWTYEHVEIKPQRNP